MHSDRSRRRWRQNQLSNSNIATDALQLLLQLTPMNNDTLIATQTSINFDDEYLNASVNSGRENDYSPPSPAFPGERRIKPTKLDSASTLMVHKIRNGLPNDVLDDICNLLKCYDVENSCHSSDSAKNKVDKKKAASLQTRYYICQDCSRSLKVDTKAKDKDCEKCKKLFSHEFYLASTKSQLQQMLKHAGMYDMMRITRKTNREELKDTYYGKFLNSEPETTFTLTLNADGIQKNKANSTTGLWPIVLILNELPYPQKRYIENILLAGIVRAKKSPNNNVIQACLNLVVDELLELEAGVSFYIKDTDNTKKLNM
ncbi:unnamed protein product [Didymodactylos carnosus]|uniref:Uncharacterized protein n=1 Tax=Didymodactylos carnosus TaxID=1234261 RepID=A0A815KBL3_9BILA|nr:unnamed protein product [Didymodactylos carnosus]CAF1387676.1 unnamed protein product [Didymodactylos carnosus]CAF4027474.1 unnamed protein product [Didymodactylos carnosus]CAF4282528.1 unnamed protein product [Didymodactylos carnosus]